MPDNYTEMIHILENVAKVNRAVTLPALQKKTGLQVVEKGQDHGMIVTEADKKVSQYLLDGGVQDIPGIRQQYSGSFSEEDDTEKQERLQAMDIYQIDPLDGTGDMVDTYKSLNVIGPTTLVSKLERKSIKDQFTPTAGLIFDVLNECALISDGNQIGLYTITDDEKIRGIPLDRTGHPYEENPRKPIKVNRRPSYPQLTFDGPFIDYLGKQGFEIERVNVGGAGTFALQFFRNYIQPKEEVRGFSDLDTLTIGFNAQPDWKTWDTNPTEVIANALELPQRTNIYGNPLKANASAETLQEMHHTQGYVLAPNDNLRDTFTQVARDFTERNPDCPLTKKDYDYKKPIIALAQ